MSLSQPRLLTSRVTVQLGGYSDTGDVLVATGTPGTPDAGTGAALLFDSHDPDPDLIGPPDVISTVLTSYGLTARSQAGPGGPAQCWIKDWSEHAGLAQSLADAGVVDIVYRVDGLGYNGQLGAYLVDICEPEDRA